MSKKNTDPSIIVTNKKARFDFFIEETFEAGLQLLGWEVKALRDKKAQLVDSYVTLKNSEAWLLGALINPLPTVSTHSIADPQRTRKLLLHRRQLDKIITKTQQKGYTCVCVNLHWKKHLIKATIALAKGKAQHDKRATIKDREWNRDKQRALQHNNR